MWFLFSRKQTGMKMFGRFSSHFHSVTGHAVFGLFKCTNVKQMDEKILLNYIDSACQEGVMWKRNMLNYTRITQKCQAFAVLSEMMRWCCQAIFLCLSCVYSIAGLQAIRTSWKKLRSIILELRGLTPKLKIS